MEVYESRVFKSQPPIVRLKGYKPPNISVQKKDTEFEVSEKDNSFIAPLKVVKLATQPASIPYKAVLPQNLGKIQKLQVLFKKAPETLKVKSNRSLLTKSPLFRPRSSASFKSKRLTQRRLKDSNALEEKLSEQFPHKLDILHYKGNYHVGKRDGYGKIAYNNGDWYEGYWSENKRNGTGTYFCASDNSEYTGNWRDNLKQGPGTMKLRNGNVIEGEWNENILQAEFVTIYYNDGSKYQGSMVNEKKHGRGVMLYPSGSRYEGEWKEDMREGLGALFFSESFFEGSFLNDYTCGSGVFVIKNAMPEYERPTQKVVTQPTNKRVSTLNRKPRPTRVIDFQEIEKRNLKAVKENLFGTTPNLPNFSSYEMDNTDIVYFAQKEFRSGKLKGPTIVRYGKYGYYEGEFKEGMREGIGKMTYTDPGHSVLWFPETEGVYEGYWKQDTRHGKGTMTWPNGLKYEGNFKKDRRHEVVGTMYFVNGNIYEGEWMEELMHGRGRFTTPDGKEYRGRFFSGDFAGEGLLTFPNGNKYEGQVKNMVPEGQGKLYMTSGNKYCGEFEKGIPHGQGKMEYKNGDVYFGEWNHLKRQGFGVMHYYETGETYEGWWVGDKREGPGTLYNDYKEALFSGNWSNDMKEGSGEVIL